MIHIRLEYRLYWVFVVLIFSQLYIDANDCVKLSCNWADHYLNGYSENIYFSPSNSSYFVIKKANRQHWETAVATVKDITCPPNKDGKCCAEFTIQLNKTSYIGLGIDCERIEISTRTFSDIWTKMNIAKKIASSSLIDSNVNEEQRNFMLMWTISWNQMRNLIQTSPCYINSNIQLYQSCLVSKWSSWTGCSQKVAAGNSNTLKIRTRKRYILYRQTVNTPCPILEEQEFCHSCLAKIRQKIGLSIPQVLSMIK